MDQYITVSNNKLVCDFLIKNKITSFNSKNKMTLKHIILVLDASGSMGNVLELLKRGQSVNTMDVFCSTKINV